MRLPPTRSSAETRHASTFAIHQAAAAADFAQQRPAEVTASSSAA